MSDSSGNLKLIVGFVVGCALAGGVMFAMMPAAPKAPVVAPPKTATAPPNTAPKLAPVAPPAVPAPVPASQTGDWRGKIEVGNAVLPEPIPAMAPKSRRDIKAFLDAIARNAGGKNALASLTNAVYRVVADGHELTLTVHGVDVVVLDDPSRGLRAIWRPKGCTEIRRNMRKPCAGSVNDLARAAFVAHGLAVVAPLQSTSMKPVRVESGIEGQGAWSSLTFSLTNSTARLMGFFNTNRMHLSYGALGWRAEDLSKKPKDTSDGKSVLANLILDSHLIVDGWRPFFGGARLPGVWCLLASSDKPMIGGEALDPKRCASMIRIRSVVAAPASANLKLAAASSDIRLVPGRAYRLHVGKVVASQALHASVSTMIKMMKPGEIPADAGGMFVIDERGIAFAFEVLKSFSGKVSRLPPPAQMAVGSTTATVGTIAARVADFEKRVVAAGHKPAKGYRLVFPDTGGKRTESSTFKVTIEIPVQR